MDVENIIKKVRNGKSSPKEDLAVASYLNGLTKLRVAFFEKLLEIKNR